MLLWLVPATLRGARSHTLHRRVSNLLLVQCNELNAGRPLRRQMCWEVHAPLSVYGLAGTLKALLRLPCLNSATMSSCVLTFTQVPSHCVDLFESAACMQASGQVGWGVHVCACASQWASACVEAHGQLPRCGVKAAHWSVCTRVCCSRLTCEIGSGVGRAHTHMRRGDQQC